VWPFDHSPIVIRMPAYDRLGPDELLTRVEYLANGGHDDPYRDAARNDGIEALIFTGGAVIGAVASGRLSADDALRCGLIVIDGPPAAAATSPPCCAAR
jgi:hypothetical protein